MRSDNDRSLLSLIERVTSNLTGVELVQIDVSQKAMMRQMALRRSVFVEIKAQTRVLRSQLEQRLGGRTDEKDPLMSRIPHHAANCVSRYRIMDVGRTPDQRRCGKTWKRPVVEFGESVHFKPVGENNAMRGGDQLRCRDFLHARLCEEGDRELRKCWNTRDGIACSVQRVWEFLGS